MISFGSQGGPGFYQSFCDILSNDGLATSRWQCADGSGNITTKTLFPDETPPVTSRSYLLTPFVNQSNDTFISTNSAVILQATDPSVSSTVTSGVANTFYSIDNVNATLPYASPIVFAEGVHALRYRSVDNAGNQEAVNSIQISADGTPP